MPKKEAPQLGAANPRNCPALEAAGLPCPGKKKKKRKKKNATKAAVKATEKAMTSGAMPKRPSPKRKLPMKY